MTSRQFPCITCGADLKFEPGSERLKCPYCGTENQIEKLEDDIIELDFDEYVVQVERQDNIHEVMLVKCEGCAAEITFDPNIAADECPYCGTSLVRTTETQHLIKPQALLPFKVTEKKANLVFQSWLKNLWFAPNKLKQYARMEYSLQGIYMPYWTYDTNTITQYTGRRGEYYYVTERYTRHAPGKQEVRTRRVRKTRWHATNGTVRNTFDDILVVASRSLPMSYIRALEPWDLANLVPYKDDYLSGFRTESYTINLKEGFEISKGIMADTIVYTIKTDIGGDEQIVRSKHTDYYDITFKHVLLPIWSSGYRFNNHTYHFLVNARTGEVQGERPWSWLKIAFTVILFIITIIIFLVLYSDQLG